MDKLDIIINKMLNKDVINDKTYYTSFMLSPKETQDQQLNIKLDLSNESLNKSNTSTDENNSLIDKELRSELIKKYNIRIIREKKTKNKNNEKDQVVQIKTPARKPSKRFL